MSVDRNQFWMVNVKFSATATSHTGGIMKDVIIADIYILINNFVEHIIVLKGRMAGASQGLIIGTPISQYASYLAMFCPLHSNISKEQY